jgi:hypothetical protein
MSTKEASSLKTSNASVMKLLFDVEESPLKKSRLLNTKAFEKVAISSNEANALDVKKSFNELQGDIGPIIISENSDEKVSMETRDESEQQDQIKITNNSGTKESLNEKQIPSVPSRKFEISINQEKLFNNLREKRRYELWKGNNIFLCYGRLMLGVHIGHLMFSISLISGIIKSY